MSIHGDEIGKTGGVSPISQHSEHQGHSTSPGLVVAYCAHLRHGIGMAERVIGGDPPTGSPDRGLPE
ncbi:MAG: hypothetical protein OXF02_04215 [Simkaniaceae bacterium]|nr:hypothetical protein [Simkaniaceae bacterium]